MIILFSSGVIANSSPDFATTRYEYSQSKDFLTIRYLFQPTKTLGFGLTYLTEQSTGMQHGQFNWQRIKKKSHSSSKFDVGIGHNMYSSPSQLSTSLRYSVHKDHPWIYSGYQIAYHNLQNIYSHITFYLGTALFIKPTANRSNYFYFKIKQKIDPRKNLFIYPSVQINRLKYSINMSTNFKNRTSLNVTIQLTKKIKPLILDD